MLDATKDAKLTVGTRYKRFLDIPAYIYNELVRNHGTEEEGKRAVFTEFLSHHPYPRWELVVDLLIHLEDNGVVKPGIAQKVKKDYLVTGK